MFEGHVGFQMRDQLVILSLKLFDEGMSHPMC